MEALALRGLPYAQARALGPSAVPVLQGILLDTAFKGSWPRMVETIAYVGSPESFSVLRDFMWHKFSGVVDDDTFRALIAVPGVLGIIPDSAGIGVTDYLEKGANPAFWDSLPWRERVYSRHQLSVLLSKLSINGLGLIPSPRAANILARLSNRPYADSQVSNITEAVENNKEVRAKGLVYFLENYRDMIRRKAKPSRPTGVILGRIADENGWGIAYAHVSVRGTQLGALATERGDFTLRLVPVGVYALVAGAMGHASRSDSVTVVADSTVIVNFKLPRLADVIK